MLKQFVPSHVTSIEPTTLLTHPLTTILPCVGSSNQPFFPSPHLPWKSKVPFTHTVVSSPLTCCFLDRCCCHSCCCHHGSLHHQSSQWKECSPSQWFRAILKATHIPHMSFPEDGFFNFWITTLMKNKKWPNSQGRGSMILLLNTYHVTWFSSIFSETLLSYTLGSIRLRNRNRTAIWPYFILNESASPLIKVWFSRWECILQLPPLTGSMPAWPSARNPGKLT